MRLLGRALEARATDVLCVVLIGLGLRKISIKKHIVLQIFIENILKISNTSKTTWDIILRPTGVVIGGSESVGVVGVIQHRSWSIPVVGLFTGVDQPGGQAHHPTCQSVRFSHRPPLHALLQLPCSMRSWATQAWWSTQSAILREATIDLSPLIIHLLI